MLGVGPFTDFQEFHNQSTVCNSGELQFLLRGVTAGPPARPDYSASWFDPAASSTPGAEVPTVIHHGRRALAFGVAVIVGWVLVACGHPAVPAQPYGAASADVGEAVDILGWHVSVSGLRFEAEHVLVDVDATSPVPSAGSAPRTAPTDLRFGLYGSLGHPIEADGIDSCAQLTGPVPTPLTVRSADGGPARVAGTVCLGPISDQAQVRGVYLYSPRDRIRGSTVAYPAAFPVGLPPTSPADTGLTVSTQSVEAWRADGTELTSDALGDPRAFTGKGFMLLGLRAGAVAAEYRDRSAARGGPMMLLAAPSLPPPGLSPACSAYGASVLVLPDASLQAVQVDASLCTQGEINAALLYATVSVAGTHAAVWTRTDRP